MHFTINVKTFNSTAKISHLNKPTKLGIKLESKASEILRFFRFSRRYFEYGDTGNESDLTKSANEITRCGHVCIFN